MTGDDHSSRARWSIAHGKRASKRRDHRGRVHEARNYEKNLEELAVIADEPNPFNGLAGHRLEFHLECSQSVQ
jgi:hypothetical protein